MRALLFSIALLLTVSSYAQEDIKTTLTEYLKYSEEKNSERIMDYMYPKFFELFPREAMVQVLDKSLNDPAFEIKLRDSEILEISPVKTADSVSYSVVDYAFVMTLKYIESEENPLPGEEVIDLTKGIFKNMYGEDNVLYDPENMKFTITIQKSLLALKTPSLASWKVLGTEANLKPLMLKIIPKEIVDEL